MSFSFRSHTTSFGKNTSASLSISMPTVAVVGFVDISAPCCCFMKMETAAFGSNDFLSMHWPPRYMVVWLNTINIVKICFPCECRTGRYFSASCDPLQSVPV